MLARVLILKRLCPLPDGSALGDDLAQSLWDESKPGLRRSRPAVRNRTVVNSRAPRKGAPAQTSQPSRGRPAIEGHKSLPDFHLEHLQVPSSATDVLRANRGRAAISSGAHGTARYVRREAAPGVRVHRRCRRPGGQWGYPGVDDSISQGQRATAAAPHVENYHETLTRHSPRSRTQFIEGDTTRSCGAKALGGILVNLKARRDGRREPDRRRDRAATRPGHHWLRHHRHPPQLGDSAAPKRGEGPVPSSRAPQPCPPSRLPGGTQVPPSGAAPTYPDIAEQGAGITT
jgi:hypothetical protein